MARHQVAVAQARDPAHAPVDPRVGLGVDFAGPVLPVGEAEDTVAPGPHPEVARGAQVEAGDGARAQGRSPQHGPVGAVLEGVHAVPGGGQQPLAPGDDGEDGGFPHFRGRRVAGDERSVQVHLHEPLLEGARPQAVPVDQQGGDEHVLEFPGPLADPAPFPDHHALVGADPGAALAARGDAPHHVAGQARGLVPGAGDALAPLPHVKPRSSADEHPVRAGLLEGEHRAQPQADAGAQVPVQAQQAGHRLGQQARAVRAQPQVAPAVPEDGGHPLPGQAVQVGKDAALAGGAAQVGPVGVQGQQQLALGRHLHVAEPNLPVQPGQGIQVPGQARAQTIEGIGAKGPHVPRGVGAQAAEPRGHGPGHHPGGQGLPVPPGDAVLEGPQPDAPLGVHGHGKDGLLVPAAGKVHRLEPPAPQPVEAQAGSRQDFAGGCLQQAVDVDDGQPLGLPVMGDVPAQDAVDAALLAGHPDGPGPVLHQVGYVQGDEPLLGAEGLEPRSPQPGHALRRAGPQEAVAVLQQRGHLALGKAVPVIEMAEGLDLGPKVPGHGQDQQDTSGQPSTTFGHAFPTGGEP